MLSTLSRYILLMVIVDLLCIQMSSAQHLAEDSVVAYRAAAGYAPGDTAGQWSSVDAVSAVKGESLTGSYTNSLMNSLYGMLPGLSVRQRNGAPGSNAPVLNIRGVATYKKSTPLIVIDGFVGDMDWLVPEEIEAISVLKDAAATAIYGSRGANGVIVVTTKSGRAQRMKVNLSVAQGLQMPMRMPDFLGAYDYARLYNEAVINDGGAAFYDEQDLQAYKNGSDPSFHPDVDWYDELVRNAVPVSKYNLNFRGGNKTVRYFSLLNVVRNGGIFNGVENLSGVKGSGSYTQYNFRANVDVNVTRGLEVSLRLGGAVSDQIVLGGASTNSIFDLISTIPPNAFPIYTPRGILGGTNSFVNPIGELQSKYFTLSGRSFLSSFELKQDLRGITEGLQLAASVSFASNFKGQSNKTKQYIRAEIHNNGLGDTTYNVFGTNTSVTIDNGGFERWRTISSRVALSYDRTFGQHSVDALVLGDMEQHELYNELFPFKHVRLAGRLGYAYKGRYIGKVSWAYEGSNDFPKGKRFGLFPAIAAGWVLSEEPFLKEANGVQYLKIRASVGTTGNDDMGATRFMFDEYYSGSGSYFWGTDNAVYYGLLKSVAANPNVTWEKQRQVNVGVDATFLNRLAFSLDVFKQHRYDILALPRAAVPQMTGIAFPELNIGEVDNQGFEVVVGYSSPAKRKLQYNVALSLWYAKNEIVFNAEAPREDTYLYTTGHAVGQPFVLQSLGFFGSDEDITSSPTQQYGDVQPGDLKYKDQNGDGVVNDNDIYPIGKPDIGLLRGGLQLGLTYGRFYVKAYLQGVSGRTMYLGGKNFRAFENNGKVTSVALGRWTPATAQSATFPRLSAENNQNNFRSSTFWQRNGDFVKLRSAEVGYNVPMALLRKLRIDEGRVFINGVNLFSLDHMDGQTDPETIMSYPAMRTVRVGVNLTF